MNTRPTSWNPGGGAELRVTPISGITDLSPTTGAVELKPGFPWFTFYCTPGTLGFVDLHGDTDNGSLHQITIQGFAPNDAPTYEPILRQLTSIPLLVRFREYAGTWRQVGSTTMGLILTYQYDSGRDVPDARGYTLKLAGEFDQPCFLLSPTIAANG
ncbi:hypothetical protein [Fibrivirga algicola]|uniref:Uncharacterized protein n=1 Tax=Fibrivirga algicola TaxID=2950420 RepID=A0ABX0QRZ1_9BACT|nr:hypothetical protein [Fibrivirga algicola]NID13762.1 hypothetical protein [Fibrivirga algicola]